MKEATGELTSTVVVITCVAILIAFFYFVIWPIIHTNFVAETSCEKAVCETVPDEDGLVTCAVVDKQTGQKQEIKCNYKG